MTSRRCVGIAFDAGIGTGGTITGVGRRLKEAGPGTHVTAVIPEEFPGIEGLKPLRGPADVTPEILDEGVIDAETSRIPIVPK